MFFERYNVVGFPTVRYLWLDTNPNLMSGPDEKDVIDRQIAFGKSEILHILVPPEKLNSYFEHISLNRHIFAWLGPQLAEHNAQALSQGSRSLRPIAKLGFYHHYNAISKAISDAAAEITSWQSADHMLRAHNITISQRNIHICVAGSLAGGTGSGLLLDTGFLLTECLKKNNPLIVGHFVLPTVFASAETAGAASCFANAYATLTELNYYLRRKQISHAGEEENPSRLIYPDYTPNWDGKHESMPVAGPPYHLVYLLGNTNNAGLSPPPHQRHEIFDIIAEKIFLNFSTTHFAHTVRLRAERAVSELATPYEHIVDDPEAIVRDVHQSVLYRESFPRDFASFGLSKIYISIDRLRQAAAYFMAGRIVEHWISSRRVPDAVNAIAASAFASFNLLSNDMAAQLGRIEGEDITLRDFIANQMEEQRRDFLTRIGDPVDFAAALGHLYKQLDFEFAKRANDPTSYGNFVKTVELRNLPGYVEKQTKQLRSLYSKWTNDAFTGFIIAEMYCKLFVQYLRAQADEFDRTALMVAESAIEARTNFTEYVGLINEIQSSWTNNIIYFRNGTLKTLINKAFTSLTACFQAQAIQCIATSAATACRELMSVIGNANEVPGKGKTVSTPGGLIHEGQTLLLALKALQSRLKEKFDAFTSSPSQFHNVSLAPDFNFEQILANSKGGEHSIRETVEKLAAGFLSAVGAASVFELGRFTPDLMEFEAKLFEFSFRRVANIQFDLDASSSFFNQFSERSTRKNTIQRLLQMSEPWLAQPQDGLLPAIRNAPPNSFQIAGLEVLDSALNRQLIDMIKSEATASVNICLNAAGTIAFYREMTGVPLFFINRITDWRRYYIEATNAKPWEWHNEKQPEKFGDIIPPGSIDAQQWYRATEAFILGLICGVITPDGDGSNFTCEVIQYDRPKTEPLGSQHKARRLLQLQEDLRERIMTRIEQLINRASEQDLLRLLSVLIYYRSKIYPMVREGRADDYRSSSYPENTCVEKRFRLVWELLQARDLSRGDIERQARQFLATLSQFTYPVPGCNLIACKSFGAESEPKKVTTKQPAMVEQPQPTSPIMVYSGYRTFISYRREGGAETARAIREGLLKYRIKSFIDVDDLGSHYFDDRLLQAIEAIPNFLVILSPGCLKRCVNETDWLRREIEHAIRHERLVIPILKPGFSFTEVEHLPPLLRDFLPRYNAVEYHHAYFTAMMEKLQKFLR